MDPKWSNDYLIPAEKITDFLIYDDHTSKSADANFNHYLVTLVYATSVHRHK